MFGSFRIIVNSIGDSSGQSTMQCIMVIYVSCLSMFSYIYIYENSDEYVTMTASCIMHIEDEVN